MPIVYCFQSALLLQRLLLHCPRLLRQPLRPPCRVQLHPRLQLKQRPRIVQRPHLQHPCARIQLHLPPQRRPAVPAERVHDLLPRPAYAGVRLWRAGGDAEGIAGDLEVDAEGASANLAAVEAVAEGL